MIKVSAAATPKTVTALILWVGEKRRFFQKYGMEINILETDRRIQTIISGEAQFALGPLGGSVITNNLNGANLRQISIIMDNIPMRIYAKQEIQSIRDLKNKTIGMHKSGTGSLPIIKRILNENNIELSEVNLIFHLSFNAIAILLGEGEIDAGFLDATYSYTAKKRGLNLLYDIGKEIFYPSYGIVVKNDQIKTNRDLIRKFLKAVVESIYFIRNQKERTIDIMENHLYFSDLKKLESVYMDYRDSLPSYIMRVPTTDDMMVIQEMMVLTNPSAAKADFAGTFDDTFLREKDWQLFIQNLGRN